MKSRPQSSALPFLLFLAGLAACSGGSDAPPLGNATPDLASRLEADLGAPVFVDAAPRRPFILAKSRTRIMASGSRRAEALLTWISGYASELGVEPRDLRVEGEGIDLAGLHHVRLGGIVPSQVRADGAGLEILTDEEGHFVSMLGHLPPPGLSYAPLISADQARASALARSEELAPGLEDQVRATELELWSPEGPVSAEDARLAHRVETGHLTVWIDALAGVVLAAVPNEAGVLALSAEDAFRPKVGNDMNPFRKPGKKLDIEVTALGSGQFRLATTTTPSHLEASVFTGFGPGGAPRSSATLTSDKPDQWDDRSLAYQGKGKDIGHANLADQVAVDAIFNVNLADRFFRDHLGRGPVVGNDLAFGDRIDVVVHTNFSIRKGQESPSRNNAFFNRADKKLYFGDGTMVFDNNYLEEPTQMLPPALALDVVAHELTHAFVDGRMGQTGQAGALEEGLADVIGQLFEREVDRKARPDLLGERIWARGQEGRNLAHPERGVRYKDTPRPNHVDTMECMKVVGARKVPEPPTDDNDRGCIHANSLVASHAWHLMSFGGLNMQSQVQIDLPLPETFSNVLWLSLLGLRSSPGWLPPPARDFLSAARLQVAATLALYPWGLPAVGCAWLAVGVLPASEVAALGVKCRVLTVEECAGKADGWYCNEKYGFSSYRCMGGQLKDGGQCPSETLKQSRVCSVQDPGTRRARLVDGRPACDSAFQ